MLFEDEQPRPIEDDDAIVTVGMVVVPKTSAVKDVEEHPVTVFVTVTLY